jgi:hypothetical protein
VDDFLWLGQDRDGVRLKAGAGSVAGFSGSAKSDLYPGLAGNAKQVKPSELPIMSAWDISRHRHSLYTTHNKSEKERSTLKINNLLKLE